MIPRKYFNLAASRKHFLDDSINLLRLSRFLSHGAEQDIISHLPSNPQMINNTIYLDISRKKTYPIDYHRKRFVGTPFGSDKAHLGRVKEIIALTLGYFVVPGFFDPHDLVGVVVAPSAHTF